LYFSVKTGRSGSFSVYYLQNREGLEMPDITNYDPTGPDSEIVAQFTLRKSDLVSLDMWLIPAIATAIETWIPRMSGIPAREEDEQAYKQKLIDMLAKLRMASSSDYCISSEVLAEVQDGLNTLVDVLPDLWL
jgi:hypothetical protein